jgi:hypothetical protein
MPRLDARIRTPGASLTEKPILGTYSPPVAHDRGTVLMVGQLKSVSRRDKKVVLGCHYTNTPAPEKGQVTAIINGEPVGLPAVNSAMRVGDGDR